MTIEQLQEYIPDAPGINTIYSWVYFQRMPHYVLKHRLLFRKQEIDVWLDYAYREGIGDFFTKKRKYREK